MSGKTYWVNVMEGSTTPECSPFTNDPYIYGSEANALVNAAIEGFDVLEVAIVPAAALEGVLEACRDAIHNAQFVDDAIGDSSFGERLSAALRDFKAVE